VVQQDTLARMRSLHLLRHTNWPKPNTDSAGEPSQMLYENHVGTQPGTLEIQ